MKKVVVKIGSSVFAPRGEIDKSFMRTLVRNVIELEDRGFRVILVSSGAIACGLSKLGCRRRPSDLSSLMAIAATGQIVLMDMYAKVFSRYGRRCAQILLTWDDFNDRIRYLNARNTINRLLSFKVMPIINENDTVSTEEIRFGDNDRLSALVSDLVGAKKLVILSDVDGLFGEDGVIPVVKTIDNAIMRLARKEDDSFTTGGMVTKLEAARIAALSGVETVVANGRKRNILKKLLIDKEKVGTTFLPSNNIERARKRWIAFSKKIKGKIYVDKGAAEAISLKGKSLLPVGITGFEGNFHKGDCVDIFDINGNPVGRGLVNYSAHELEDFKGKQFMHEVIHQDNFVKKGERWIT